MTLRKEDSVIAKDRISVRSLMITGCVGSLSLRCGQMHLFRKGPRDAEVDFGTSRDAGTVTLSVKFRVCVTLLK